MHSVLKGHVHEVCADMPENFFGGCLCDPPYGIKFMGRQWDHGVPSAETWAEVLRVLKPGAHLLAFGGTRTYHRLACAIEDAGFEIRDCLMWLYGQGFPKGHGCLKPSWEPCILAAKPGKHVLNIDESRVGTDTERGNRYNGKVPGAGRTNILRGALTKPWEVKPGRWPANLILDEESAALLDEHTENRIHSAGASRIKTVRSTYDASTYHAAPERQMNRFGDSGGASRFFYHAKVSKAERNAGTSNGNQHPTLKPIDLCRYLAKLILPPQSDSPRKLLVPFSGSGSEMIGALRAGWDEVTGIEQDAEFCHVAEERLQFHHPSKFALVSAQDQ